MPFIMRQEGANVSPNKPINFVQELAWGWIHHGTHGLGVPVKQYNIFFEYGSYKWAHLFQLLVHGVSWGRLSWHLFYNDNHSSPNASLFPLNLFLSMLLCYYFLSMLSTYHVTICVIYFCLKLYISSLEYKPHPGQYSLVDTVHVSWTKLMPHKC